MAYIVKLIYRKPHQIPTPIDAMTQSEFLSWSKNRNPKEMISVLQRPRVQD